MNCLGYPFRRQRDSDYRTRVSVGVGAGRCRFHAEFVLRCVVFHAQNHFFNKPFNVLTRFLPGGDRPMLAQYIRDPSLRVVSPRQLPASARRMWPGWSLRYLGYWLGRALKAS